MAFKIRKLWALPLLCLILVSCGIKPGDVEPPEGPDSSQFPNTYPDLKTDPEP